MFLSAKGVNKNLQKNEKQAFCSCLKTAAPGPVQLEQWVMPASLCFFPSWPEASSWEWPCGSGMTRRRRISSTCSWGTSRPPTPSMSFFTCLVILFACEVAAGIWGFVNKDQIAKDVKQFYDQAFQQALMAESETNNGKAVVKTFHETLDCCGPDNAIGAITPLWRDDLCPKKDSILKNFMESSNCHKKIDELFSGKLYLIGIAAIVVAVIMIFEMILSMVLCCGIRNSSVY
uniref:CD81 molecule n=1 Tax=Accipiter nisus TaxID=211598 RepID=A0A8B9NQX8_9AVES